MGSSEETQVADTDQEVEVKAANKQVDQEMSAELLEKQIVVIRYVR